MTLVAAYRELGVPMVVGDFLITGTQARPTSRKKVHLISDNLAVGWTGHLIAAREVTSGLRDRFIKEKPTKGALEEFLTSYANNGFGSLSVHLLGWIHDEESSCFRWNSQWPSEVFYSDYHYGGSGETKFKALAGTGSDSSLAIGTNPISKSLHTTCYLMADEIGLRSNQAAGFGKAYELLYLDAGRFRYVDDVLYLFCEVWFDSLGRCMGPRLYPIFHKYQNAGEFSIIQVSNYLPAGSDHAQYLVGNSDQRYNASIDRFLITPVYSMPEAEIEAIMRNMVSPGYPISLESQHACMFVSMIKDADKEFAQPLAPLIMVTSKTDPIPLFTVEVSGLHSAGEGSESLEVQYPSQEVFKMAYDAIVRSST